MEDIIKYINYAVYQEIIDDYGSTEIMRCIQLGKFDECMQLIEMGCDISIKDNDESTVMNYRADHRMYDFMIYLINKGFDINSQNVFGETPLF